MAKLLKYLVITVAPCIPLKQVQAEGHVVLIVDGTHLFSRSELEAAVDCDGGPAC